MRKVIALSQRLYVRIYAALLASLVALGCMFAVVHWIYDNDQSRNGFDTFAEVASEVLPPPEATRQEQRRALMRWRQKVRANMALYTADGELIAGAGPVFPPLPPNQTTNGRIEGGHGALALKLQDGRWLVWQRMHGRRFPLNILLTLAMVMQRGRDWRLSGRAARDTAPGTLAAQRGKLGRRQPGNPGRSRRQGRGCLAGEQL
ncbi:hypothetical protein LP419_20035 [Massilia sp. H-1]|nr:hypothetical protein LP419_20035 [Massilia sp. H-1]